MPNKLSEVDLLVLLANPCSLWRFSVAARVHRHELLHISAKQLDRIIDGLTDLPNGRQSLARAYLQLIRQRCASHTLLRRAPTRLDDLSTERSPNYQNIHDEM